MDDQKDVPGWPNDINDENPNPQSGGVPWRRPDKLWEKFQLVLDESTNAKHSMA